MTDTCSDTLKLLSVIIGTLRNKSLFLSCFDALASSIRMPPSWLPPSRRPRRAEAGPGPIPCWIMFTESSRFLIAAGFRCHATGPPGARNSVPSRWAGGLGCITGGRRPLGSAWLTDRITMHKNRA